MQCGALDGAARNPALVLAISRDQTSGDIGRVTSPSRPHPPTPTLAAQHTACTPIVIDWTAPNRDAPSAASAPPFPHPGPSRLDPTSRSPLFYRRLPVRPPAQTLSGLKGRQPLQKKVQWIWTSWTSPWLKQCHVNVVGRGDPARPGSGTPRGVLPAHRKKRILPTSDPSQKHVTTSECRRCTINYRRSTGRCRQRCHW